MWTSLTLYLTDLVVILFDLIFILFAVTRSLFHVVFKKEEDVTILCNSGLVTQRSRQQAPRVVVFSISLSSGITEPSQSCSCVYLSHKDLYKSDSESEQERIIQKESSKPCHHCQNWNMSVTAVVKCPRCFWHDNNSICPVCGYDIPVDNEHIKEAFARCNDCGATCYENMKTSKVNLYFPSED